MLKSMLGDWPGRRKMAALFLALLLMSISGKVMAEKKPSEIIEAAFELLEEGNPFTRKYEEMTGRSIEPLFPYGVPYYFGGLTGSKGSGWFYAAYPDYFVKVCEAGSHYFRVGTRYFYGLDCSGFVRHVYKACRKPAPPALDEMMSSWGLRRFHLYDDREGFEMPPYDQLQDTLQAGDLLVIKHEYASYRHVMMYIGTLRDFGYTGESEPALASWLDYPLVIHCGTSPFYGERFQQLINLYPEKYGKCTTTDGGVAVSIVGPEPADATDHGFIQSTNFHWFTMNDSGYQLSLIDMNDVIHYCWYRP